MYATHFGLRGAPFSIAPDPRYLFMSERHREALAHLLYGVRAGGGFVLLSGEIGAGKTTVCRCFLEHLPAHCRVAYIFNPKLSVLELLQTVCDEWHIALSPGAGSATVKDYTDALNAHLLACHARGESSVLVIDEAQNLSADVLEQLRLLTNLETNERKLLQIILIGQPELRELLARPELEQLAQRVVARCHLGALTEAETAKYVSHRLAVAGHAGPLPFDGQGLRLIHDLSRGVPRRINLLCDRALLGAYSLGQHRVDRAVLMQAAREVFDTAPPMRANTGRWRWGALVATAAVAALGLAWWTWGLPGPMPAPRLAAQGEVAVRAEPDGVRGPAASAVALAMASPEASAVQAGMTSALAAATAASPAASIPPTGLSAALPAASEPGRPASGVVTPVQVARTAAEGASASAPAWSEALWWRDEDSAWRAAAIRWGVSLPARGEACPTLLRQRLSCFRGRGSLAQIRLLDRPTLLSLVDGQGASGQVLLLGFSGEQALLNAAGGALRVPVDQLLTQWRGDFATLWRSPPGYAGLLNDGRRGPAVVQLRRLLDQAEGRPPTEPADASFDAGLKARVSTFQARQGLTPDGLAGPTTFMLLNRATGVAEPRLQNRS